MALIDVEGGDHLNAALFVAKGWSLAPDGTAAGRVRGHSWRMNNSSSPHTIQKILPSSYSTVVVGIGFFMTSASGGSPGAGSHRIAILTTSAGPASPVATIGTDASGRLTVSNSAGVVATGTVVIALDTWYYIEVKIVVGSSGSCELHLNGISGEIASTTANFGTTNVAQIAFVEPNNNASDLFLDDLYLLDTTGSAPQNDFLGDVTVETLYPNADGTHQDWAPSTAGSHFSNVNESSGTYPDGDTTYVSDVTPGAIDTYTVGALAALTGTVFGVATNLYARKDDAAARTIAPVIREAGTDYVGATTVGLTTSYLFYRQLYPLDPAGAAWTIASVNGSEYGVKEVA